jgi:hypothetical protein
MKHSALRDAWTGGSGENKTLFSQQKIYILYLIFFQCSLSSYGTVRVRDRQESTQ